MRFNVHCANPETGEECDWQIDCATIQEAEQRAHDAGMFVSRIVPIADPRNHPTQQPPVQQVAPVARGCRACGSTSIVRKKIAPSFSHQVLSLLLILFGLGVLFVFPIGCFISPPVIILALYMDSKRRKVLQCAHCRAIVSEYA